MRLLRWGLMAGLALGAVSAAAPAQAAEKYSLLVGINDYAPKQEDGKRGEGDLSGCENDVRTMKTILSKAGFKSDAAHQKVILSTAATGQAIVDGLVWLINSAKPEDTVVFYYSGHGTYSLDSRSQNKDEQDGYDEAICPTDDKTGGIILDDDIQLATSMMKSKNITLIFDCCFSGGTNRIDAKDPRTVDPFRLTGVRNRKRSNVEAATVPLLKPAKLRTRAARAGLALTTGRSRAEELTASNVLYLGGAQPWEVAGDGGSGLITDNGEPAYEGGFFTTLLYRTLNKMGMETSWRNIMKEIRRQASLLNPLQEPYAEGPIGNAPFSTALGVGLVPQIDTEVPPVNVRLTAGVVKDASVQVQGPDAAKFRAEVIDALKEGGLGDIFEITDNNASVQLAILDQGQNYKVWVPWYDGEKLETAPTFDAATTKLSEAIRFAHRQRQLAALYNPRSPIQVTLTLAGGVSPSVEKGSEVKGQFTVSQACTAQVMRLDVAGNLVMVGDAMRCEPGTTYHFGYNAGMVKGKELVKVVVTKQSTADLSRATRESNMLNVMTRELGSDATRWAEDQETLYVGDWRVQEPSTPVPAKGRAKGRK